MDRGKKGKCVDHIRLQEMLSVVKDVFDGVRGCVGWYIRGGDSGCASEKRMCSWLRSLSAARNDARSDFVYTLVVAVPLPSRPPRAFFIGVDAAAAFIPKEGAPRWVGVGTGLGQCDKLPLAPMTRGEKNPMPLMPLRFEVRNARKVGSLTILSRLDKKWGLFIWSSS